MKEDTTLLPKFLGLLSNLASGINGDNRGAEAAEEDGESNFQSLGVLKKVYSRVP